MGQHQHFDIFDLAFEFLELKSTDLFGRHCLGCFVVQSHLIEIIDQFLLKEIRCIEVFEEGEVKEVDYMYCIAVEKMD